MAASRRKSREGCQLRRISTDEERQPFSLEAQQERLAAYVAAQPGWVLARSYSERTRMGLARKAARGEWTGGTPPFGYRYHSERRSLLPVPAEAALVQRIFTLYADRRLGSAAISGLLNDAGQPTTRGRRWTPNRILGMLRNPTYIGQLPYNGQQHQASHEPIIDPELFQRAQLLLAERSDSPRAQATNATDYLLTSFLRCQRCGHGFVGTAAHGNGGVYRYYTCFSRQRHGTARCDQQRLPAGPLEEAIVAEVLAALDDGSIFQEAARRAELAWHAQHPGRQVELAGCGQPLRNGGRRSTGTCGPSRPSGCPSRPARIASPSWTGRCKGWRHVQRRWRWSATPPPRWPRTTSWSGSRAGSSGP